MIDVVSTVKKPSAKRPRTGAKVAGTGVRPGNAAGTRPGTRRIVVVIGLSGAGRNTALHALEDFGYVAVDNLPLQLLDHLLTAKAGDALGGDFPIAIGLQVGTTGFSEAPLRPGPDTATRTAFRRCLAPSTPVRFRRSQP